MRVIPEQYVRVTDLKLMQKLLCSFMQEIHEICEKHGLSYSLFGGSLLGAVRHQNIIPWDDDIDIIMPRPDYEKLVKIIQTEYVDQYEIYDYPKENYIYPFGKICRKGTLLFENSLKEKFSKLGLYIDIFPLDGAADISDKERKKLYKRAQKYKTLVGISAAKIVASRVWWKKPFVIVRWLRSLILNIVGYRYFLKKQIDITRAYSFEECDNVAFISSWGWGEKGIMSKQCYYNQKLYNFGIYQFWGIKDYDTYLSKWYWDYMTPPPEDKQLAPHNYELYVKKEIIDNSN